MLRLLPFLLVILWGIVAWQLSARRLARALDRASRPLNHPRLAGPLAELGRAMGLPPIRAHLLEDPQVNGLAAPDGRVFLTRGLVAGLDRGVFSPAEVASVVAHELGHVAHGHARRRMLDVAGGNALRLALAGLVARVLPGIAGPLAGLAGAAMTARLSREDEYQADAFASALMLRAGLGTAPQKALLARLDAMAAGRGGPPRWLASHPPASARIAAIERLEARWREG